MALFTGMIRSQTLEMDTGLGIVFPHDRPPENMHTPSKVLYLLHGLGNSYLSWSTQTAIERYAREAGVTVIMPDVQKSFYKDMVHGERYFSYLTQELPLLCQTMFCISSKREDTFVAGLSMGGYGALKCGLRCPEQYAGCGSFSGSLDLSDALHMVSDPFDISRMQSVFGEDLRPDPEDDLYFLVKRLKETTSPELFPKFFLTCGEKDFLYSSNVKFASFLEKENLSYEFQGGSGNHNWEFWNASVQEFFTYFF